MVVMHEEIFGPIMPIETYENFKDGLGGLICVISVGLCWWNVTNQFSFLTFKSYEIEKPYLLQLIEGIIILLIGGSLTVLILGI